jgi:hypothetical protein
LACGVVCLVFIVYFCGEYYSMSILDEIYIAQRNAGEAAVIANLERLGLVTKAATPLELMTIQRDELLDALKTMMRNFPTDFDLAEAGWDAVSIETAMKAHDIASTAIAKAEGITP